MNLVVGCPVAHRQWVLPAWFGHVRSACAAAGVDPEFVFVCDPNDPSWDCIREQAPAATLVECVTTRGGDVRRWNQHRYRDMVSLRNRLLEAVQTLEPDAFLSLDSDILLHPDQVKFLLGDLERFDAVGGRCYMTAHGTRFPSWGRLSRNGGLQRQDAAGVFDVDVIMAIKMMSPDAYWVPYALDLQGEDIGWSRSCRARGLRLGWDGRVVAKHVLAPHLLEPVDVRVGF